MSSKRSKKKPVTAPNKSTAPELPLVSLAIIIFVTVFFGLFMVDQFVRRGKSTEVCGNVKYQASLLGFPFVSTKVIEDGFSVRHKLLTGNGTKDCIIPEPHLPIGETFTVVANNAKVWLNAAIWSATAALVTFGLVYARRRYG